jgi:hypothetical protein
MFTMETGCWRQGDLPNVASMEAGRIFGCRATTAICCFEMRDLVVGACSLLLFIVGTACSRKIFSVVNVTVLQKSILPLLGREGCCWGSMSVADGGV